MRKSEQSFDPPSSCCKPTGSTYEDRCQPTHFSTPARAPRTMRRFACITTKRSSPLKAIDFMGGVNVTLGLPFVRTSPDHGTALDIAGQGTADETSMLNALKLAAQMARRVVTHEGLFLSAHG